LTTVTGLDQNVQRAQEYLEKVIGARYSWWTGGGVPDGPPAWARNGPPPQPANVKGTSCFCAGVANLARRAVGLEIPTLGNPNYDGGVVAYFGCTGAAPPSYPRRGYFEVHGRQRRFDLEEARRPWTLIGRKYRNVRDQGHVAIVLPGGKVLQSYDAGGGRPGINKDATLERSHDGGYYEVMVRAEDWLLPFDADREGTRPERPRPERPERPEPERPEPERPEPERPEPAVVLFTARQLSEIAENPNLATLERYRNALVPEMQRAGITTHARVAAFLANVVQETDRLKTLEEYGDRDYWMYLDRNSGRAGEWRYHGRGFLMNTWKDAYARLSGVLGVDLVSDPDLLTRPDLAAKAATWFWSQHNLNAYADRGEFKKVCAIINTGSEWGQPNGLADRLRFYDRAKRILPGNLSGRGTSSDGYNHDGLPYINLAAVEPADETAAFALATEIRRVGIGVTVTNGARNVGALAKIMYDEPLGYRQLWVLGGPALDACGDYGDLANWPVSPKTDYYNLAGRDFSGTCRRAAELADEKVKEGIGRRFLEEMGMAGHTPAQPAPPTPPPPPEDREPEAPPPTDYAPEEPPDYTPAHTREPEEPPSPDGDTGDSAYPRERDREPRDREPRDREAGDGEPVQAATGVPEQDKDASGNSLVDRVRNNKALITWVAGVAVTWLVGQGYIADGDAEAMTTNLVVGILFVLGLLARQLSYGPVTVEKEYSKKEG
jgi:predicted chitinase